jgi:type I restriction enzyme M protein
MPGDGKRLDVPTLETWLWEAACKIRGPLDAPKFKDYILPLIFLKRLSDVFEDELLRPAYHSDRFASRQNERTRRGRRRMRRSARRA